MKRRVLAIVLASLLLGVVVGSAGVASATTPVGDSTALSGQQAALSTQANETATSTPTATPTPSSSTSNASRDAPATAETVRILPVQLEPEYYSVTTAETSKTFNTSGPFALLSSSEPVDQAAIEQPGATATVLEGGRTVKIEYADDAAPVGKQSLYELTLWYGDDSSRTLNLYAERTSVDVGASSMKKYRPLIQDMLADAEDNGYPRSPEGAESHYQDVKETAQLLNSLLTEQAKRLFGALFGIVANPLGIALILVSAALLAYYQIKRNGQVLEVLSNDSGKSARLRERLWLQYKQDQQTAAEEPLRELRGVGEMGEIYWSNAFNVDTTAGLAELFRTGLPVRRNGETKHVGGVDNLDVEEIDSSWLEPVCRDYRLPSPELALAHGKTALRRMVSEYGMGHVYEETYRETCELIDELDETKELTRFAADDAGGSSAGGFGGGASPGDD